jgi:hypothetical protein
MANERDSDIGQMWRQQPHERQTMALEEIRAKASALDAKVKRWNLIGGIALAVLLAKNLWEVWIDTDALERAGDLLLFLALLFVVYHFRGYARADAEPATLGLASCVEHYRSQLMRQRDLSRDSWKWVLPFVPGIGLNIIGGLMEPRTVPQIATLIVLGVATFVGVLWVNARTARQLEREIAALESQ